MANILGLQEGDITSLIINFLWREKRCVEFCLRGLKLVLQDVCAMVYFFTAASCASLYRTKQLSNIRMNVQCPKSNIRINVQCLKSSTRTLYTLSYDPNLWKQSAGGAVILRNEKDPAFCEKPLAGPEVLFLSTIHERFIKMVKVLISRGPSRWDGLFFCRIGGLRGSL